MRLRAERCIFLFIHKSLIFRGTQRIILVDYLLGRSSPVPELSLPRAFYKGSTQARETPREHGMESPGTEPGRPRVVTHSFPLFPSD